MINSRWISKDYKTFNVGDIICNTEKQDLLRLIVHKDEDALWCVGLVHAALTENNDTHPVFPMRFVDIENGLWNNMTRLGNLKDYMEYIDRVQSDCIYKPDGTI